MYRMVAVVLLLLLVGCGTGYMDAIEPSPSDEPTLTADGNPTPSDKVSTAVGPDDPWYAPWTTQQQWLESMAWLAWSPYEPPDPLPVVEIIREIHPDEAAEIKEACRTEAGFPPSRPGRQEWVIPDEQWEAFALASFTCWAQFPMREEYVQQHFTRRQAEFLHEYLTERWLPCATALGVEVTPPPTLETFLDEFVNLPLGVWMPSTVLHRQGLSSGRIDSILEACPEMPPASEMAANR